MFITNCEAAICYKKYKKEEFMWKLKQIIQILCELFIFFLKLGEEGPTEEREDAGRKRKGKLKYTRTHLPTFEYLKRGMRNDFLCVFWLKDEGRRGGESDTLLASNLLTVSIFEQRKGVEAIMLLKFSKQCKISNFKVTKKDKIKWIFQEAYEEDCFSFSPFPSPPCPALPLPILFFHREIKPY
ncbi:hypothetical protein EGR_05402 [Echinococcus granulosus]|uniref:Uncharacterized protein n=1 Tax=Echinococcus granulosus TaxID=6210 RepID=W6UNF1_ECHGR|nr:hypothetical protein EGR_05402 [Echinococcus granulosus]EUB59782.1 hypothetical protein EGR_05402 [Echinococcus granulosus]